MRQEDEAQRRHGLAPRAPLSLSRRPLSRALVCVPTLCSDPVFPVGSSPGPPPVPPRKWLRGPDGVSLLGFGGRRALGEKAFSSDPRGCLGVPDPPAAAPPLEARSVIRPCVRALGPLSRHRLLRGRAATQAVPYRGPRLPPPSRGRVPPGRGRRPSRGKALRLRERATRVLPRAYPGARGGSLPPRSGGVVLGGGAAEAFPPSHGVPAPRASSGSPPAPAARVRSRRVCCAGTVGARLIPGGRSARDASPRPGRNGQMNGWAAGRGKPRRLPLWLLRVACVTFPRRRGALARAAGGGFGGGALGRIGPGVPGVAGPPCVCLWRWDPRVCIPGGPCPGPAPRLDGPPSAVRAREQGGGGTLGPPSAGGQRAGGRGRWAAGPGGPAPRGWLKVVPGGESQSAFPGSPRDRPTGPGGAPLAVRPRVCPGAANRLASRPCPFSPSVLFSPSETWSSTSPRRGWPRSPPLRPPVPWPPCLSPPAPRCPGGGRLVSSAVPACPSRPPGRRRHGGRARGRVSPPGPAAAPAPCPPPPAVAASVACGRARVCLPPRGPVRKGVPERRPGPGQPS